MVQQQAYQVVGPCAHVKTATSNGVMTVMLFKRAVLPPDVPPEQIEHLLSVKLIAPVAGVAPVPVEQPTEPAAAMLAGPEPDGSDGGGSQESPADGEAGTESDIEAQRVEARAKLEAAGGKPTGRHGQPVWAEHLVNLGYDYALVSGESKEELQKLAGQITSP
jgi:hypothetical protein